MTTVAPLAGVRIIEASMLGPAAITQNLTDLGAEVIKVEPPNGDYGREMTWPIVDGTSLLFLHANRGKKSIVLDLRTDEGIEVFKELAKGADAVVEAMRPGALARRGLGYEDLKAINPEIVFMTISGYGMTGPYKDLPSHGIAYDTWAGIVPPAYDEEGFCYIPEHVSIGINAAPVMGAMGILAGIIKARATGEGCQMEIAQADAAAATDWLRSETWKAYERPEDEVTGNKADDYERRAPGTGGMKEGVRYQMYDTSDGHILFMSSEQSFWKSFCENVGRPDLFEKWPGSKFADHARGNRELQRELRDIFLTKTSAEWMAWAADNDALLAPVNTPQTLADDPHFKDRLPWLPKETHGADMLPSPVKVVGGELSDPGMAPTLGQHTDEVLRDVLGLDEARIASLREAGAVR
ncbi:CaiB/BaiF CoA transferase family protein [Rhabdothermincola salaria]|uniref:CaiB/BaiF CoA transferase family protein n=1 Tax=Rhabdothermincola salaria TaxID=2903142 RepID=UPI001E58E7CC|nr:CaiB/BaiF CoA-transferase family protein [Rhabdothermincola salaria]MCD9623529.1 CoA transferase [Rhabdothermincola salaria]